jgi:hypothetical protein
VRRGVQENASRARRCRFTTIAAREFTSVRLFLSDEPVIDRNESCSDRLPADQPGDFFVMSDDNPQPPFVYEGLDPAPEPKSAVADVTDAVKGAANRVSEAIESGRKPGMPLSILSNIAREAPLGSLLVAFLLGMAVARRR